MSGPALIPQVELQHIPVGSERRVAQALMSTLDDGWTIFHSYCWLRSMPGYKKDVLKEGEADFILLHRKWGLLILEVKGGDVRYDTEAGRWIQNMHFMKDPFAQARANMHALKKQIVERCDFIGKTLGGEMPCPYGYAVVFPDCNFSGTLPAGVHESIIFGAKDLPQLGQAILNAAKHWSSSTQLQPMEPKDFKSMKQALTSTFRIVVSVAARMAQDEEILIKLTEDQAEKLEGLYANSRVAIEGVAGSGKTLLAMLRAQAYAKEGKEVLFLCYNRKLAEALSRRTANIPNIKVVNFHRLCHDMCEKAGIPFEIPDDFELSDIFWSDDAPTLLMDAIDELPQNRYDALVVDEAQDFKDLWWMAIEKLNRQPRGPLYLFYDRAQNVFGNTLELPATATTYNLGTNCRNTKSIAAKCSSVLGAEIRTSPFSPTGDPPVILATGKAEEIRKNCADLLTHSIGQEGISPSRIAILSTKSLKKSCLSEGQLAGYKLTDDLEQWEKGKAVWFSSVKAFKGLEADILILIEAGDFHDTFFSRHDLYVAASRARHRLVVMTSSKQVEQALKETASVG